MTSENLKKTISKKLKHAAQFFTAFLRWLIISSVVGVICGVVGTLFHITIDYCTEIRQTNNYLIYFLPLGGLLIVFLYKISDMLKHKGTDNIIESVRGRERVPLRTAPLIFIATAITHLFGGSAGREGAALQLGGSIGYKTAEFLKFDKKDKTLMVMCGMSALFSALFGTPLTAAIFAIEVTSVGMMYYSGLLPCMISALVAFWVASLMGVESGLYKFIIPPEIGGHSILSVIVIAIACAVVSIIFCMMLHGGSKLMKRTFKNEYIRIAVGGLVIIVLTVLCGCNDYNGAGTDIIQNAAMGTVKPEAFILKMIFTAVTISAGYKGGEIVPTFFVGATLGCLIAQLMGLDGGFGAAVGMTGMFCAMVNCPLASIILSVEMFGDGGFILFAITAGISYMLSGYYGLYHSQRIMYSKIKTEFINKETK